MKTQTRIKKVPFHFLLALAAVNEVDRLYPTEKACMRQIWRRIRKDKRCQFCNSKKLKVTDLRTGSCGTCGKMFWLTAGTTFERMRAARPYLVALHLVEKGIPFSARMLSRLCSIADASAQAIFKKIMGAVWLAMPSNVELVSSFEFNDAICKRSFETEARKHPVTEQVKLLAESSSLPFEQSVFEIAHSSISLLENGKETTVESSEVVKNESGVSQIGFSTPMRRDTSALDTDVLTTDRMDEKNGSVEETVYNALSYELQTIDSLVSSTGLSSSAVIAAVSMLRLTDAVCLVDGNRVALSVERLKASPAPLSAPVQDSIRQTVKFIKKFFHGVSRRYVQLYLAAYWCFIDRERWTTGAVFAHCCRTKFQLRSFVSPLHLKFWCKSIQ